MCTCVQPPAGHRQGEQKKEDDPVLQLVWMLILHAWMWKKASFSVHVAAVGLGCVSVHVNLSLASLLIRPRH